MCPAWRGSKAPSTIATAPRWWGSSSKVTITRSAFGLALLEDLAERAPPLRVRVLHDPVRLAPLVILRQVLRDRHALRSDEEQAVAVLPLLHLVARADPAPVLRLGGGIRIEVARAERPAHRLDVVGEAVDDGLGHAAVGVERRPRLLRVLLRVLPHLVDVRLR